jgi:hypothetical protein
VNLGDRNGCRGSNKIQRSRFCGYYMLCISHFCDGIWAEVTDVVTDDRNQEMWRLEVLEPYVSVRGLDHPSSCLKKSTVDIYYNDYNNQKSHRNTHL